MTDRPTNDVAAVPDVRALYDDGYFDKDEQGWCSRNVAVDQDGRHVRVRRWGDDNGLRAFDELLEGEIVEVLHDRGLVVLGGGLASFVFDLGARRLVHRTVATRNFVPPAGCDGSAFVSSGMQVLLDIAAVLGAPQRRAPPPPPWPEGTPSPTCQGAMEQRTSVAIDAVQRFSLLRRVLDDRDATIQVHIVLEGAPWSLQLSAWDPERGTVIFGGPVALEPAVDAVLTAWRAGSA